MAPVECPPGFRLIKVQFHETSTCSHDILFKENKTRNEELCKPRNRTLLVSNVPPYCNEVGLKRIFSRFGLIDHVILEKKLGNGPAGLVSKTTVEDKTEHDIKFFPSQNCEGFHYAFIVFRDSESVAKSLSRNFTKNSFVLSNKDKPVKTGMKKWTRNYIAHFPDKKSLQNNIDEYMGKYDAALLKAEENEINAGEEADEDGWIKVTKKGKNPVVSRTEANQLKAKAKEKMRRKRKELLNAYSYQIRESKREKIAELRKKFEEDKDRVQQMRESRKFRPF